MPCATLLPSKNTFVSTLNSSRNTRRNVHVYKGQNDVGVCVFTSKDYPPYPIDSLGSIYIVTVKLQPFLAWTKNNWFIWQILNHVLPVYRNSSGMSLFIGMDIKIPTKCYWCVTVTHHGNAREDLVVRKYSCGRHQALRFTFTMLALCSAFRGSMMSITFKSDENLNFHIN